MFGLNQQLPDCLKAGEEDIQDSKTKISELIARRLYKELNGDKSKIGFEKILGTLNKTVVSQEGEEINGFDELWDVVLAQPDELFDLLAEMRGNE